MIAEKTSACRKYPLESYSGQLEIYLACPPGQRSWFLRSFGWIVGNSRLGISTGQVFAEELKLENRPFPDEESAFDFVFQIARHYRLVLPGNRF